jgi:uncharacterized membrane protein YqaE (UPF0057 family)
MKSILTLCSFLLASLFITPDALAVSSALPAKTAVNSTAVRPENAEKEILSRKEKREMRKEVKSRIKSAIKSAKEMKASDDLVLLVILGILIPPLAMALYDGISNRFWISLLLTLLFWLPGVIYTLYVILSES